ncbi:M48 family metalloprotease [Aeoliella mucimassa]|uniref:TPR repeat-containing protein YfgC n=1 Tax=Aeoliella mucimassa TaxID=2527972 RepID=A0A518AVN7_9BACT|nr:M48 family metalloprotease [Aeoliella mucimassa]QDU58786.1 TPR repeat-containing protein YfgC precursor [Aeoliella mucimassa]
MARISFPIPTSRRGQRSYRSSSGRNMFGVGRGGSRGSGLKMRLIIAAGIAIFALISYYGNPGDKNQITGEVERVAMADEREEEALGLQAAPQMIEQHGGESPREFHRRRVSDMGKRLLAGLNDYIVERSQDLGEPLDNPYEFKFHLLADSRTVNAFALPGGQVFITEALYARLETDGQLAGVLGHEIGHVIERHGNKRMAQQSLFSGLAAAAGAAGGDESSARMAQAAAQMISMSYGRDDELESDKWGVRLCVLAGYDPNAMVGLMRILDEASPGGGPPEMLSTHPKPANRVQYIQQVIEQEYPNGLPPGLEP